MDVNRIRDDFPCLNQERNGKCPIYMDNACMTLKPSFVINKMNSYYNEFPACGGHGRSAHWFAKRVQEATYDARDKIRSFINARNPSLYDEEEIKEIIWTRNTTEGINLIANSYPFSEGDEVLITDHEHNSNLIPWLHRVNQENLRNKIKVRIVESNEEQLFDIDTYQEKITKKVKLISMVHTSNLDGRSIPVKEIVNIAHDNNIKVLIDGAQSAPHQKIDVIDLDVDFFTFSIHKMVGPSGMGVLYCKKEEIAGLSPFIVGGDTVENSFYNNVVWQDAPYKFEAGLRNYAGQIGAGAAAEYLMNIGMDNIHNYEYELNKYMSEKLLRIPEVTILGPKNPKDRAGIVSFKIKRNITEIPPSEIARILDNTSNIMIRSGDHCVHSWFNAQGIGKVGSARASLYIYNTFEEIDLFIDVINKIISEDSNWT